MQSSVQSSFPEHYESFYKFYKMREAQRLQLAEWIAPIVIGLVIALVYLWSARGSSDLQDGQSGSISVSSQKPGDDSYLSEANERQTPEPLLSFSSAVNRASPSVVNIYTSRIVERDRSRYTNDPMFRELFNSSGLPQQRRMQSALGSGVIVSADGLILTNFHVINGAIEIVVALQDGRDAKAELIGTNLENDLAVLRIKLPELNAIGIADPDSVLVGDVVLAIGNPFGMGQSVTQGIVSATRRRGLNISYFENFIQTDAAINPGNSGGALVNSRGELIGINIANFAQNAANNGFGFAIPVDVAMRTLQDVVRFGQVVRGWLGVTAEALSIKKAQSLGLENADGILLAEVTKGGPADLAGLKEKDVILAINDMPIDDIRQGIQEIAESRPGENVLLDIVRKGTKFRIEAVLGSRPEGE